MACFTCLFVTPSNPNGGWKKNLSHPCSTS
jgi:hypothetical protein